MWPKVVPRRQARIAAAVAMAVDVVIITPSVASSMVELLVAAVIMEVASARTDHAAKKNGLARITY